MKKVLTRDESLALKGIAVFLMVFHHCFRSADKFARYTPVFSPLFTETQVVGLAQWAKICVALFAFVSGYGLMYGYRKLGEEKRREKISGWVKTHLISTLSGYWFVAVIAYILMAIVGKINFSKWGSNRLEKLVNVVLDCVGVSNLFGTKTLRGAWWYMGAAVVFIVLVPVLAYLIRKLGGTITLLLVFLFPRIAGIGFPGGTATYSFLPVFVLGMLACEQSVFEQFHSWQIGMKPKVSNGIKFVLTLFLVVFGVWSYNKIPLKVFWEYHYAMVPFIVILFLEEYVFRISWVKRLFGFLGKYSLYIWLIHTFVRDYLGRYVWSVRYFWLVPVVILVISLGMGIILDIFRKYCGYNKLIGYLMKK